MLALALAMAPSLSVTGFGDVAIPTCRGLATVLVMVMAHLLDNLHLMRGVSPEVGRWVGRWVGDE